MSNPLPELPRKNKRSEANITPRVMKWFEKNWENSCAIEIKTGTKLKPHQKTALMQVAGGSFIYKMADMGNKLCYDCFMLKKADAFVVTCKGYVCSVVNLRNNEEFTIKV